MEVQELKGHLHRIGDISNDEWIASLDDRKLKELEFHNRDRENTDLAVLEQDTFDKYYANKKYYSTVQQSVNYTDGWIEEHANGKVFLDYACGAGGSAIKAANAGASLGIGFDISDVSIRNARANAERAGVSNIHFIQADAENTKLPDKCIDAVVCSGVLHHLDLSYAFPELRRILAPGGRILAVEALDYNPLIKLYRKLTPDMRTEWEKSHILNMSDIRFASRFFDIGEIKFWHVTSYAGAYFPRLLPAFDAVDGVLARIPGIRLMAWIFTFELLAKDS